jgi:hypothetical protein
MVGDESRQSCQNAVNLLLFGQLRFPPGVVQIDDG